MKKIDLNIDIQATPEAVWAAIISDKKYRVWTEAFDKGSYFEGGWQKGDRIKFLSPNEHGAKSGMISEIAASDHLKYISIHHLGFIMDDVEDYTSDSAKKWTPAFENYYLEAKTDTITNFHVLADIDEDYFDYFNEAWISALNALKKLCEENLEPFKAITVEVLVDASAQQAWIYWTMPEYITKWAFASEDWHCPKAINNLRVGGHYSTTMASKDGQMAFDFGGTYTVVEPTKRLINQLDDGRMVWVTFEVITPQQTLVVETFEAEDENTLELQRAGWQAILNNFKLAVEAGGIA